MCAIYSCTKDDSDSLPLPFQNFSANKTTAMNYTYDGVVEQNGRLVFDDFGAFKTVLDSLEKNDSTYTATHPEPNLVDANGLNIIGISPILDDFEDAFSNFTSYHRKIEIDEVNTLNAGNEYDVQPLTEDDILATVLNEDGELRIGTTIYKVLNECQRLIVKNLDEAALQRFNSGITNPIFETNLTTHSECYRIGKFEDENCIPIFTFFINTANTLSVEFFNKSFIPANSNTTYHWDFGDGNSHTGENPPTHTFSAPGTYNVCLSMLGDCVEQFCREITVLNTASACHSDWMWEFSNTGFTKISFFSSSFASFAGGNLSFSWDFGDGSKSSQENPTHTYATSGSYTVCLTITDSNGCTDSKCEVIQIGTINGLCFCKGNLYQYDKLTIGDRRMKKVTSIQSYWWLNRFQVIAKTKSRKQNNNGKWRRRPANFISASVQGKVYVKGSGFFDDCDTEMGVGAIDDQNNKSIAIARWRPLNPVPAKIRVKEPGNVIGTHQMTLDGFQFPTEYFPLPTTCIP